MWRLIRAGQDKGQDAWRLGLANPEDETTALGKKRRNFESRWQQDQVQRVLWWQTSARDRRSRSTKDQSWWTAIKTTRSRRWEWSIKTGKLGAVWLGCLVTGLAEG